MARRGGGGGGGGINADYDDEMVELDEVDGAKSMPEAADEEMLQETSHTRNVFPETWLWTDSTLGLVYQLIKQ